MNKLNTYGKALWVSALSVVVSELIHKIQEVKEENGKSKKVRNYRKIRQARR